MTRILFADTTHPKPYDFQDLAAQAMGGTESSLLRTAAILQRNGHQITVFQQAREQTDEQQGVHFIGPDQLEHLGQPRG